MNRIPLFYWSSVVFENKPLENYGDLLSKFIVEKVSDTAAYFYNAPKSRKSLFKKKYLMAIGSILSHAQKKATVWGSGIITSTDQFDKATFYAVRGPLTRKRVLELGYDCPAVYGDPALLLPLFYKPKELPTRELGIIPHYADYQQVIQQFDDGKTLVVDLITDDIFKTTDVICSCERIISSSLHGVIIAHAYGIPALWVPFSDRLSGDNVKFKDYFLSVHIEPYRIERRDFTKTNDFIDLWNSFPSLPEEITIKELQKGLLEAFPSTYKNNT